MKVDLFLVGEAVHQPAAAVPSNLVEYGMLAEHSGFDGVWLAEHHFIRYGACPSPPILASHLLARTSTLQVGSAACVLSTRHPVALAEEAVMLDRLSDGRFMLGVARGGPWVDLEVFGTGIERFESGFNESLELLTDWLNGCTTVDSSGKFFDFRSVPVLARPAEDFPVWVAATSKDTVGLAARRGLPLLLGVHATDDEKAALIGHYTQVAEEAGRDPFAVEHAAVYLAYAGDTVESAGNSLREPMTRWLSTGVGDYLRLDGSRGNRDQRGYVERLVSTHLVGPPAKSAEALRESMARTGISRAMLLVEGMPSVSEVQDNIARLGAELLTNVS